VEAQWTTCACAALALRLCGCASDPRTITVEIIPGHETGAFHEEPAVAQFEVRITGAEGAGIAAASAPPGGELDFGEMPADQPLTFDITGRDAGGATIARGRSMGGIFLDQLAGDVLPLFAQRLGAWSRPPGELPAARAGARAIALGERHLILTGGDAGPGGDPAGLLGYDLLAWQGTAGQALPRAARSLVGRGDAVLLIDDGGSTWVNFASGAYADVALPAGLGSFAEVAGGGTVEASDGRSFVVGATRAGAAATAAVLVVEADGALRAATLANPRAGAAAVWIEDAGLVVAGGSATAPGVEVLEPDAAAAVPRPFPPDETAGAGAVVGGLGDVVLVGGVLPAGASAATRRLDPRCSASCEASAIEGAGLPAGLAAVAAFALPGGKVIAVGSEAVGEQLTRSFWIDLGAATVTELPLREPRAGASVTPAPNGTLALLGGTHPDGTAALTVEMVFPE
jgi:hypothetical protein